MQLHNFILPVAFKSYVAICIVPNYSDKGCRLYSSAMFMIMVFLVGAAAI